MSATATVGTLEAAQELVRKTAAAVAEADLTLTRLQTEAHISDEVIRTRARMALSGAQQNLFLRRADDLEARKDLERARQAHTAVLAAERRAERARRIRPLVGDCRALLKKLEPIETAGGELLEGPPALSAHVRQWLDWATRELSS